MNSTIDENDSAITAQRITIERDGAQLPAYYAAPRDLSPSTPGIVITMHVYGVDSDQRDVARRFAKHGFATVVPDLFARFDAPSGDGETDYMKFIPFAQKLSFETVDTDVRAAAAWLRTQIPNGKMAIAGFCMGGVMAMRRSSGYSDIFGAVAAWYGISPDISPESVDIPVVASYGGADASIPAEKVHAFFDAVSVPHDVKIYPGAQHAFFDRTRAAFNAEAAADSWNRAIAFLKQHLVALARNAEGE